MKVLTLAVLLGAGTAVAAATQAKVVVVVGPVGSHNAHYKDDANDIVTEAKRYTSNVTKIFTPNATWAKVKAAAQGANVFVYLGHGNGWPSIYAPFQMLTKDGLGPRFAQALAELSDRLLGRDPGPLSLDPAVARCAMHPLPMVSAAMSPAAARRAAAAPKKRAALVAGRVQRTRV